jgi:NTP pyrophosphatase (non-canonical NTP hydrolase)
MACDDGGGTFDEMLLRADMAARLSRPERLRMLPDALAALERDVDEWQQRNLAPVAGYQPLLVVAEEVGELCHAHVKGEQGIRGTAEEHESARRDACGDIVIALCAYCGANGIDLGACVQETWAKVSARDWRANPESGEAPK